MQLINLTKQETKKRRKYDTLIMYITLSMLVLMCFSCATGQRSYDCYADRLQEIAKTDVELASCLEYLHESDLDESEMADLSNTTIENLTRSDIMGFCEEEGMHEYLISKGVL